MWKSVKNQNHRVNPLTLTLDHRLLIAISNGALLSIIQFDILHMYATTKRDFLIFARFRIASESFTSRT